MISVSGISVGLPGKNSPVFSENNFQKLIAGENFIDSLTQNQIEEMLGKNLAIKNKGSNQEEILTSVDQVTKFAGLMGRIDLAEEYGISRKIVETMDITTQLAIAAGLNAIKDAGITLLPSKGTPGVLERNQQRETGIIFATSFPGFDSFAQELDSSRDSDYRFNRKILFNLLVMANAQLAELIKAKGPNTQMNAACASTSQAVGIAEDWINSGRCSRVIVISADVATSQKLLPWLGSGFLVLNASTIEQELEKAAVPFGKNRSGMILGMGAASLVLEKKNESDALGQVQLLGTHIVNAAYHATSIDSEHLCEELEIFIKNMETKWGLDRKLMCKELIYMSHETFTSAHGGAAKSEVTALETVFKEHLEDILICNTKGFTGHPMGVNIEDVTSVYALRNGVVPPIANLTEPDPDLGKLNYSKGGKHDRKYVLRYAGGFGSQVVFILFGKQNN